MKTDRRPKVMNQPGLFSKPLSTRTTMRGLALACLLLSLTASYSFGQTKTIVDEWGTVQAPKPPGVKACNNGPENYSFTCARLRKTDLQQREAAALRDFGP